MGLGVAHRACAAGAAWGWRRPSAGPSSGLGAVAPLLLLAASGLTACGRAADPVAPLAAEAGGPPAPRCKAPPAGTLAAVPGPTLYADVGAEIWLDASCSPGAVSYAWNLGDGRSVEASSEPLSVVRYDTVDRHIAVLTVTDAEGRAKTAALQVVVTLPPFSGSLADGAGASSVLALPDGAVWVLSQDAALLSRVVRGADAAFEVTARVPTPADPRTISLWGDHLVVVCQDADRLAFFDAADGTPAGELSLGRGRRPYAAARLGADLAVTLQGTGQIALITNPAEPSLAAVLPAVADARGLVALPDGRLAVTRWRSGSEAGSVAFVSPDGAPTTLAELPREVRIDSDTEISGVPTYLGQPVLSPAGHELYVPGLLANDRRGLFVNGLPLTQETSLRATLFVVDVATGTELLPRRKQFDDRGLASAIALSPRGDFAFIAMRGNRVVERFDLLRQVQAGTLVDLGYAPEGLAVSGDGRTLFVEASLSRQLVVVDLENFDALPEPLARLPTVSSEPLAAAVLRGKQLFNDSADVRLTRDGYVACAHCHLEGLADNRVWDFTDRGEGLRNTTSLRGRAGLGDGPLHWSANFDEVQDFEHDIRNAFLGLGLMSDADFFAGGRDTPLGASKGGVSADLDALAAYVVSLGAELRSPFRADDGSLTAVASLGRGIFESSSAGCTTCHSGPRRTDSPGGLVSPLLHDVGTLGAGSGQRLGDTLPGLDTPTLVGLWHTAPYLHDGSAPTLRAVLVDRNAADQHGTTSHLSELELAALETFLLADEGD